jgi:hypothetical protein
MGTTAGGARGSNREAALRAGHTSNRAARREVGACRTARDARGDPAPYRLHVCRSELGQIARTLRRARQPRSHERSGLSRATPSPRHVDQRHRRPPVLDGVFIERAPGRLEFHAAPPPSDAAVTHVLVAIRHRVRRLLARRGLEPDTAELDPLDGLADASPILTQILSASVQGPCRARPTRGHAGRTPGRGAARG